MRGRAERAVAPAGAGERATALAEALHAGGPQLEGPAAQHAYATITKVRERTALVGGHTVVAVAGATGSGKSSTVNALVGEPVSTVGARRPTTSSTVGITFGPDPATPLLDWLGVGRRHQVASDGRGLDGLVLLDLPDFDSHAAANRAEADRVLGLADVFCWVTDPQKYADAKWHDEYLARYREHDAVMVVVLNQADRLSPEGLQACLADLRALLAREGFGEVQVLASSAVTREGLDDLVAVLRDAVSQRTAAERRLLADLEHDARDLRGLVADTEPSLPAEPPAPLVEALGRAAGVPVVLDAVQRDQERQAALATGWPFTRWTRRVGADPLRRYRLKGGEDGGVEVTDVRSAVGRSSLPAPTPAARSAVELQTRRLADDASAGLPPRWAEAVHDAAAPEGTDLVDSLDQTVLSVPLTFRRPLWWSLVGVLQWLLAAVAVAGLLWLVALQLLSWAAMPVPEPPRQGIFPWPLIMLVLGVLLGLMIAGLSGLAARSSARRRRAAAGRRFDDAISQVAAERLLGPVDAVLDRHRATRSALDGVLHEQRRR